MKANNMNNIQSLQTQLNAIQTVLSPWQDKIAPNLHELNTIKQDLDSRVARLSEQGRNLNIAIMGQVKAGKSTFLNALLFDGKPILPEAATPKTANLTRISYAEQSCLRIEYYTPEEWADIIEQANQGGTHAEAKAAIELKRMAENSPIDIAAALAQGEQHILAASIDDLLGKLNDYAGNNGAYTALVKMTHLQLPLAELKGYDIVDTPGMNDPVISRTLQTQKEMARSDVVFFLSRCSQFLDESDMQLLSHQLPTKGVKRLVLVGGQFDSAILDVGYDRSSLQETEAHLKKRLSERAAKEMTALAEAKRHFNPQLANLLQSLVHPILSSTYAYSFSKFPAEQWQQHESMKHVFDNLTCLAKEEWQNYQWTQQDWQRIANFQPLIDAYHQARQDKEAILQEQLASLQPDAQRNIQEFLQSLAEQVKQHILTLQKSDLNELTQKEQAYLAQIQTISTKLEHTLNTVIQQTQILSQQVSQDLQYKISEFNQLSVRTGTEEKRYAREVKVDFDLFDWDTWFTRTRTVYHTKIKSYQYFSPSDAATQVQDYAQECIYKIQTTFNELTNTNQIKIDLRKTLANTSIMFHHPDYDPIALRHLLEQELRLLVLPELPVFNTNNFSANISRNFQNKVRGNTMNDLEQALKKSLQNVFINLNQYFTNEVNTYIQTLETIRDNLSKQLTHRLQKELAQTRSELANKQDNIKQYQSIIQKITPFITNLGQ